MLLKLAWPPFPGLNLDDQTNGLLGEPKAPTVKLFFVPIVLLPPCRLKHVREAHGDYIRITRAMIIVFMMQNKIRQRKKPVEPQIPTAQQNSLVSP